MKMKISFLGDICLNNTYSDLYLRGEKPFAEVSDYLFDSNYVVGNLECLAEGAEGENILKNPRLKTNLETLNFLKDLNLNLATLAHNHSYDNLLDGFVETTNFLESHKIEYMGAAHSFPEAEAPKFINIEGISFCFLNYVSADTNPKLPEDAKLALNYLEKNKVIQHIKEVRTAVDFVVLLLHWGGKVDHGYYPHHEQRILAKQFIDVGADLIVGHHTHTLQPYEKYKGKYIFYSLGNFCLSDFYFEGRLFEVDRKKGAESIILQIVFDNKDYSVNLIPIKSVNNYITVDISVINRFKRRLLYFKILTKIKPLNNFYYFKRKYIDPGLFYLCGNDRKFFQQIKNVKFDKILNFVKR